MNTILFFFLFLITVIVFLIWRKLNSEGEIRASGANFILDTSAIIDGRINNLCGLGILRGAIIVPTFVVGELESILGSDDIQKSIKGTRGKAILTCLPRHNHLSFEMPNIDYKDLADVDDKIVRFAKKIPDSIVVTCDDELIKKLKKNEVKVLVISEIMKAVRPLLIPGETEAIQIVEKGNQPGQGRGYLQDGTIVIVENAENKVGELIQIRAKRIMPTKGSNSMVFAVQESEEE